MVEPVNLKRTWITKSALISPDQCLLFYFRLIPSGPTLAQIRLYDGLNTKGDVIAELTGHLYETPVILPEVPIYCKKGLYVECVTALDGVLLLTYSLK